MLVEDYHQQAGPAGRDGLPSLCLTLYTDSDIGAWYSLLEKEHNNNEAKKAHVSVK